jgi:type II secretory pathway component PulF
LRTLFLQAATPAIKDLVFELISDLDSGLPLSKAIEKRSDLFGDFYSQMVKSGEISGRLEEVLIYLADYAEHENDLRNKIRSASTYPVFLFTTFMIVGVVITVALAPQMVSIFEEFGRTPPLGTQILIFIGEFFKSWGLVALILLVGIIWFLLNYFQSKEGRRVGGVYMLKMPILGDIYKKIYISRFCETAGTLIFGGIPIVTAFEVAGEATGNYVYQVIGYKVAESVKRGESISNTLKEYNEYLPPLVSQMTAVGESTGRLDSILKTVSGYYQKEVDRAFSTMVDLLQPILIIFIGVLVAFLVSAVLFPIYQLAQSV